jgi:dCMP deaminase
MKQKFIDYYMNVAELTAKLSYAVRLQVGAVIVKGNKILATGYNGMPSGWDNTCEEKKYMGPESGGWLDTETINELFPHYDENGRYVYKTRPEVLHAESNAILKVSSSTESSEGASMFCTHAPCIECAKLIYQSGINSLFYRNAYRDSSGLEFLEKSGVRVTACE